MPILSMIGKLSQKSDIFIKRIWGKHYAIQMQNKRKKFSTHEKMVHKNFGAMSKMASQISRDPSRRSEYNDWAERGYVSRYHYILAMLVDKNKV